MSEMRDDKEWNGYAKYNSIDWWKVRSAAGVTEMKMRLGVRCFRRGLCSGLEIIN